MNDIRSFRSENLNKAKFGLKLYLHIKNIKNVVYGFKIQAKNS